MKRGKYAIGEVGAPKADAAWFLLITRLGHGDGAVTVQQIADFVSGCAFKDPICEDLIRVA